MNSHAGDQTQLWPGSPIRTSSDQHSLANSPRHIAGCNVLLRPFIPRHPPNALKHLQNKKHTPTPATSGLKRQKPHTTTHHKQPEKTSKNQKKPATHTGLLKVRACKDARVHYTIPKHHTNTPTSKTTSLTHQEQHGHDTQKPNSMPSITITVPNHHNTTRHSPMMTLFNGWPLLPRKEVIQPHLPVRLPCYDFVPVTGPTLGGCFPKVSAPTLGVTSSHDVTGGVYKARERIHRRVLIGGY